MAEIMDAHLRQPGSRPQSMRGAAQAVEVLGAGSLPGTTQWLLDRREAASKQLGGRGCQYNLLAARLGVRQDKGPACRVFTFSQRQGEHLIVGGRPSVE